MQTLRDYALSFVGRPYLYGGSNAIEGFDCSGVVVEILQSVGVVSQDLSAQGLFDFFKERGAWNVYGLGALAFFGKSPAAITHVGFSLDKYRMLEAGGGNHTTTSLEAAVRADAMVRIRPIARRSDLVAVIMPFYKLVTTGETPHGN